MGKKHNDTTISLAPLTFEEAMRELVDSPPKREDSQAEESGSTKEAAPGSAPSKQQTSPRRIPSSG